MRSQRVLQRSHLLYVYADKYQYDASLSPHLHNLGVWLDGIDGVAITVVVHERVHRVDHRTFLINLTEAHSIDSLEPTIDLSRNREMDAKNV